MNFAGVFILRSVQFSSQKQISFKIAILPIRMSNWASLVHTAVKAEVPDYEIMQTMSKFLGEVDIGDEPAKRLAKFFRLNPATKLKYENKACFTFFIMMMMMTMRMGMMMIMMMMMMMFHGSNPDG